MIATYTIEGVSPGDHSDTLELEWMSPDNGVTWSNPAPIGTFDNTLNSSYNSGASIVLDPTDNIVINGPWGSPGGVFGPYNVEANTLSSTFPDQNIGADPHGLQTDQTGPDGAPGEESDATPFAALTLNPAATPGNGTGTLTSSLGEGGGSVVGVWDNAQNGFNFNYAYLKSGLATTAANIDDSANWVTTHMPAGVGLGDASLAGGGTGPWLLENSHSYPALSEWDQVHGTFTPESEVDCGDVATSGAGMQSENLSEAGTGQLELVYSTSTNFVSTLKYANIGLSVNGFVQNYPLALDSGSEYHEPRVDVNVHSQGIVIWDDPAATGTPIKAVWLPNPLPTDTALPACKSASTAPPPVTKPISAKGNVSGLHVTVSTPAACDAFDSKVAFTIASSGKLTKGTKIGKVEFFVGKGLKRTTGHGKHKKTVYLPNLTASKLLGVHTVNTGGKGETPGLSKTDQITVHVVSVVKVTKGKIVKTKTSTIAVPFDVCSAK